MPEILSITFAVILLVLCAKLMFAGLADLKATLKRFLWYFSLEIIFSYTPQEKFYSYKDVFKVLGWLLIAVGGGLLFYAKISVYF